MRLAWKRGTVVPEFELLSDRLDLILPSAAHDESVYLDLARMLLPGPRTPGLHCSDVIRDLAVRQKIIEPGGDIEDRAEIIEIGNAIEWARTVRLCISEPQRYRRVEEIVEDGLPVTPDLYDATGKHILENDTNRGWIAVRPSGPHEIKARWLSVNTPIDDARYWMNWTQVACQCYVFGSTYGRLDVTYMRGDWKDGPTGKLVARRLWGCQWTEKEIERIWRQIINHKEVMEREAK